VTGQALQKILGAGLEILERLHAVQRRRELPTRITQRVQVLIKNRLIGRVVTT
jgi:hypothetical protein